MENLDKTFRKIQELQETIGKEFGEVAARNEAIAKLAAIKDIERRVDENLSAYEKFPLFFDTQAFSHVDNGAEREKRLAQNQKAAAGILTAIEFAKGNPMASATDLQKLRITLPPQYDWNTIVLIGRCARIADKYAEAKPKLTAALLSLITNPTG